MFFNIEIKARYADLEDARRKLQAMGARFAGTDEQRDTYFIAPRGRLKLREGPIENALIFYERIDTAAAKESRVTLARLTPGGTGGLRETLKAALGVSAVVSKRREIYFLDNVKVHLDEVAGLGTFIEFEAKGEHESERPKCQRQIDELMAAFGVTPDSLQAKSYADMMDRG
jgi:adenylate cyclase, class 2